MIAEFKVQNFYSIRTPQVLSFIPSASHRSEEYFTQEVKPGVKLLKMGLIYGANASGKTNILRALDSFRSLLTESPDDKLRSVRFIPFLLDDGSKDKPTSMEMTFYVKGLKYNLTLLYDSKNILEEVLTVTESTKPALLYKRSYNPGNERPLVEFGTKSRLLKKSRQAIISNTINNSTLLAAFGKTNTEPSLLDDVFGYFSQSMKAMIAPNDLLSSFIKNSLADDSDGHMKKFLLQLLKVSDFNIVDVEINEQADSSKELNFGHATDEGIYRLPERFESVGTIKFLGMSVLLSQLLLSNRFISIDEVESSIHSELVSYFIKLFIANSESHSQLVMTTHDINLMNEDFLRRDVLWSTDKLDSGETFLNRFSDLGIHNTASIYNAYRQGKLGKVPFVGSIYLNLDMQ